MSAENQNQNAMDETIVNEAVPPMPGAPATPAAEQQKGGWLPVAALACGVLALLAALGGVAFVQTGKAGHDEVQALRGELKKRDAALAEMQTRVEALVGEVSKLNEAEAQRAEAAAQAEKAAAEAEAKKAEEAAEAAARAAAEKEAASKDKGKGKAPGKPSAGDAGDKPKPLAAAPQAPGAAAEPAVAAGKPEATRAGSGKPSGQSCDLVGKSAEEQAAILKRCVSLIEPPARTR